MLLINVVRKFFVLTCFSCLGAITSSTSVYGFNIVLDTSSPIDDNGEFIYTYDITLESGESLVPDGFDNLILENLAEVTKVEAFSPYLVTENGFDSTSANFEVAIDSSPQTNFPGVIEITSTSSVVGNIDYVGFYNDSNNLPAISVGQVLGPIESNSIPFTFSPSLGLLISASFLGISYFKHRN